MELETLRHFVVIAKLGNMTRAAAQLNISQPALSRQVQTLETELGQPLFNRANRQLTLTPGGHYLVNHAEELLTLADKTVANMTQQQVLSGKLYIGAGETRGMQPLVTAFETLHRAHPGVQLKLFSGASQDVFTKLDNGILDFGLITDPQLNSSYDSLALPSLDRWGVLLRSSDPLAKNTVITPTDLLGKPLIFSQQTTAIERLRRWSNQQLTDQQVVATYNLIYNASLLAQAGLGYVIGIAGLINTSGDSELCFRPLSPTMTTKLGLIWPRKRPLSPVASHFLTTLQAQLNPDSKKS
ncbi:LysR family transcriptional regulator [Lactiplantibacillus fabifermentans]|uniref:Fhu operon transcription regulator n=2 Tax=Lactiplantibacillus fabifermentans TaxID=483011 RepID=A0A0R2NRF2_9LACO|nr:LysR family transcriptional regulator [Lactiplantibacillus fabifermentans]ETY74335.1 LysR family transcriptional regulator [Lactiplantibacillus fabifermentans T30PCM01]KRO27008.1 fhu operon transcription regulator [Lactiplantibacillus fabifermentans DSM 21115]